MDRAKQISRWIKNRKDQSEKPMPCMFHITIPKFLLSKRIEDDESIKILTDILDKYKIKWNTVDTIPGAFCLNRDWIETGDIPCYIEYCGVYPVEWDVEDVVTLEQMDYEGKVIIRVVWHMENGKYVPNN